ncbi:MAG: peptidyl-prolyl cis-trans isomerase [Chloracidobacterium sp.]|nr:peptidyl-prolyl cis-trans isomerase [Chloracidobacterium sp.]
MRSIGHIFIFALIFGAVSVTAFAQETQTRVVDEVVAQVNDGVITLSRIKREMKDIVDNEVQQGKKREDVQKMVDEKQGELIANLINEELLIQKAKEMGLDSDIESSVNQRMADIMKQYNLKTVEALYAEMEKSGVSPQEMKESWRKQATRDMVLQREVEGKVFWGLSGKELKDYYDSHKEKFTKPETISISELFLGFAGRDETAVREKAKQLLAQLRAGGDWAKIVKENGDTGVVTQGTGKAEKLKVKELVEILAKPLKGVKVGEFTEPFDAEQLGVVILRVDDRESASNESVFDENSVRSAMAGEKLPAERVKFFSKLRADAYIKISETYRPIVSPILFADERKDKPGN